MKKIMITLAIVLGISSFLPNQIQAQHISVNINIGNQPAWGPVGYDYAPYYYFPDIDCYYNIDLRLFYYWDRGRWISARYLPYAYCHYDLYRTYKVVINDHDPWRYHTRHRQVYAKYRGHHNQPVIHYSKDKRYKNSRKNKYDWRAPEHRNNNKNHGRNKNDYRSGQHSAKKENGRQSHSYDKRNQNQGRNNNKVAPVQPQKNNGRSSNSSIKRESTRQATPNKSRSEYNSSLKTVSNRQATQRSTNRTSTNTSARTSGSQRTATSSR